MIRLEMRLQYDITREATKMSVLLSGKTNKYEYLTGEEILPPDKSRMLESGRIQKTKKSIKNEKQVQALKVLQPAEYQQKPKIRKEMFPKEPENLG